MPTDRAVTKKENVSDKNIHKGSQPSESSKSVLSVTEQNHFFFEQLILHLKF